MAPFDFTVPAIKKIRLIIDTDAKNEADDQYAIVHALLTQKFVVKGVIGAHFGTHRTTDSMMESCEEVKKVMSLMGADRDIPICRGATGAIAAGEAAALPDGSRLIIEEAMKEDALPLFGIFLGPLTDMAIALQHRPEIAERMTVVWIGGNAWPDGGHEFNLHNDPLAADVVFSSGVNLWQIPRPVYNKLKVSLAELEVRVKPYGKIGEYLFTQLVEFNDMLANNQGWPLGESWVLGDSAAVGVLLDSHEYDYEERPAPRVNPDGKYLHRDDAHLMRVYHDIDVRFILADFYAKLQLCYPL